MNEPLTKLGRVFLAVTDAHTLNAKAKLGELKAKGKQRKKGCETIPSLELRNHYWASCKRCLGTTMASLAAQTDWSKLTTEPVIKPDSSLAKKAKARATS